MAGISSKAFAFENSENNKNKFQDQELNPDLGVNYYEFKYRNHDVQIGRFIQIDPLANEYVYNSTYAFSENKVTGHIELEGLESARAPLPEEKSKKTSGFSFTAAVTLGTSIGVSAKIEGTPYMMEGIVSAGEIDLFGVRDNKFTLGGKTSDGTKTSRSYYNVNIIGFGMGETLESKTTQDGEYSETLTESLTILGVTRETTYSLTPAGEESKPQIDGSLQANVKVAAFVGVDIQVKIPWSIPNSQPGLRPGNYPDNTGHKPILKPLK